MSSEVIAVSLGVGDKRGLRRRLQIGRARLAGSGHRLKLRIHSFHIRGDGKPPSPGRLTVINSDFTARVQRASPDTVVTVVSIGGS